MLDIPKSAETPNIGALAMWRRERFTGLTTTALTLSSVPRRTVNDGGLELLHKNGALLDPGSDYTISGASVTLGVAAIAGDVFVCLYPYREQ